MQHKASIDVVRYAIRVKICRQCWQRPEGSEIDGPLVERACESKCTIFMNLPQLHTAMVSGVENLSADEVMHNFVCPGCHLSASAGDFCADGMTRTCPLSRYSAEVTQILEDVENTLPIHHLKPVALASVNPPTPKAETEPIRPEP